MLSSMVVAVEENPNEPALVRGGSPYNSTLCAAAYGPEYPAHIRELAFKADQGDDAALDDLRDALLETFPRFEAILRTTQAVDLVQGGVKVNALPEKVSAVVNHRIAEHSSVRELQQHIADTILPIAKKYDLTVDAFGTSVEAGSGKGGRVALSDAWGTALEPSPVTPTGKDDPYQILAGTIKATIESSEGYNATAVVVAPLLAIGNTGQCSLPMLDATTSDWMCRYPLLLERDQEHLPLPPPARERALQWCSHSQRRSVP